MPARVIDLLQPSEIQDDAAGVLIRTQMFLIVDKSVTVFDPCKQIRICHGLVELEFYGLFIG